MQFAHIGEDIWLGNYEACNVHGLGFDNSIHIWHPKQPGKCNNTHGLQVCYLEDTPLDDDLLDLIWRYSKSSGNLFIHCAAGLGRSPTLAILAKASRGADIFDSMGVIARAMWEHYGIKHAPQYSCKRLNEIFEFVKKKGA